LSRWYSSDQLSDDAVPRRTDIALAREPFPDIQAQIADLMMSPARAVATDQRFRQQWQPGGY